MSQETESQERNRVMRISVSTSGAHLISSKRWTAFKQRATLHVCV